MDEDIKNNLSTIAVIIYGVLSPYLAQYLSSEQFSALFIAIVSTLIVIYSARHPNTMEIFGNKKSVMVETEEDLINDEYAYE